MRVVPQSSASTPQCLPSWKPGPSDAQTLLQIKHLGEQVQPVTNLTANSFSGIYPLLAGPAQDTNRREHNLIMAAARTDYKFSPQLEILW